MKVLIIEDEIPAAEKLERYLSRYDSTVEVVNRIQTVKDSVDWLGEHQNDIDLVFMDIQLLDGRSFDIFDEITIKKPIIFVTAFDDYAIDAFKVNSVDYLLKPITFDDLTRAMDKLKLLKQNLTPSDNDLSKLQLALNHLNTKSYKERFMVKLGDHIKSLTTNCIELFYADGRSVYLVSDQNRKFIIDYKMEELQELLNPQHFFRVNRSFILNIEAISDVIVYSNSRLKITLRLDFDKEIIVSRDKVGPFKQWFSGME